MSDDPKYYDLKGSDISPRALSTAEYAELTKMFRIKGWEIFMELRQMEADECVEQGMDVALGSVERGLWRAKYQGCLKDTRFEAELEEFTNNSEAIPFEDLNEVSDLRG